MNDQTLTKATSETRLGEWYSWDSPIGLGAFFVCLALVAVLIHFAIVLH